MADRESKVPASSGSRTAQPRGSGLPLTSLHREIDRLFDDFSRSLSMFPFGRGGDWEPFGFGSQGGMLNPDVDVVEKDNAFEITAELPGLAEDDIDVSVSDGILTLKGEKKEEKEETRKGYRLSERRYGSFQRSFRLPEGVDEDKIEADFDKGILKLLLPKTAEAAKQPKRINLTPKR